MEPKYLYLLTRYHQMSSEYQKHLCNTCNIHYLIISYDDKYKHWRLYAELKEPRTRAWMENKFQAFLPVLPLDHPMRAQTIVDHYKKGHDYVEVLEHEDLYPKNEVVKEKENVKVILESDSEDDLIKCVNNNKAHKNKKRKFDFIVISDSE